MENTTLLGRLATPTPAGAHRHQRLIPEPPALAYRPFYADLRRFPPRAGAGPIRRALSPEGPSAACPRRFASAQARSPGRTSLGPTAKRTAGFSPRGAPAPARDAVQTGADGEERGRPSAKTRSLVSEQVGVGVGAGPKSGPGRKRKSRSRLPSSQGTVSSRRKPAPRASVRMLRIRQPRPPAAPCRAGSRSRSSCRSPARAAPKRRRTGSPVSGSACQWASKSGQKWDLKT